MRAKDVPISVERVRGTQQVRRVSDRWQQQRIIESIITQRLSCTHTIAGMNKLVAHA